MLKVLEFELMGYRMTTYLQRDEKEIRDKLLEVLASSYESIFLVDIADGQIKVIRKNIKLPEVFWDYVDTNPSYNDLLEYYVKMGVAPVDRNKMFNMTCYEALNTYLTKKQSYTFDYRVNSDESTIWYRVKFARLDEGPDLSLFAVGFENISDEKHDEELKFSETGNILIVDNNEEELNALCSELSGDFDILTAKSIKECMDALKKYKDEIILLIINLQLGDESGFDLMLDIIGERKYKSIPIIVTSDNDDSDEEVEALELGASDFLHKPLNMNVLAHKILSMLKLRASTAMLNTLERDPLTGLYNREFFYRKAEEIIHDNPDDSFRIVVSNIEKFKLINEKYGIEKGDEVLRYISRAGRKYLPDVVIGGRINADIFVILQRDTAQTKAQGKSVIANMVKDAPVPNLVMKYGFYFVGPGCKTSVQTMCDRARLAVNSINGVYGKFVAVYDDKFRQELLAQKQITDNMEEALADNQFAVYLQPKVDAKTGITVGAEALVRWIHPELGFISPGDFIPLFEMNGFITSLDKYVALKAIETLVRWKKEGRELIPISINLSRRDFEEEDMFDRFLAEVDEAGLPHDLIHIEITETAFSDNPERIGRTIKKMHDCGFVIELDDFGTGYSSLTTLNSIDIDVLKLDMSIIKNDIPGSDRNVLDFCMQLVKMLKLKTVAEGAETKEQVERLGDIGCDYIQGYYFSKPLPIADFEKYVLLTR